MKRRIQPCVESSKYNPLSASRRYPSDNIHGVNSRMDFKEIAGATKDRARNASTAEGNSDDEATLQGSKHFGATMYLVSHWAKFYTHHWYMASRAYKFGLVELAECKCCRDGVKETTAHMFQCPDRNEVHLEHHWKLTELLADQQLSNGLLHLNEVGIDLALLSDNTHQGVVWDGDEEGNDEEKRVAQLLTMTRSTWNIKKCLDNRRS